MAYNPLSPDEIREAIFQEAKRQFLENGFSNTEMKSIAEKVGIGRSTLYRYFPYKEQLAFIVTVDVLKGLNTKSSSYEVVPGLTAYDKLALFCKNYIDNLENNKDIVSYLTEFDRMFENEYPAIPEARDYIKNINELSDFTSNLIVEGIQDKSIQINEDPKLFTLVLINTMLGLAQRLFILSEHILLEQGIPVLQIIHKAVELLLSPIKAPIN